MLGELIRVTARLLKCVFSAQIQELSTTQRDVHVEWSQATCLANRAGAGTVRRAEGAPRGRACQLLFHETVLWPNVTILVA